MAIIPQKTETKKPKSEAAAIMEKYRKNKTQLEKKQQQFREIDSEEGMQFSIFSSVMSGCAIGALAGIIAEDMNIYATETPHGMEVGLSVGAGVCSLGIIYYILKRKRVLKQINKLEEQQKNLSQAYDQTPKKSEDIFMK